jgi:hypothetical protein
MNITLIQRRIILLGLLLVPFLSLGELINLFSGTIIGQDEYAFGSATGIFKISKDIVFISLIFFGVVNYVVSQKASFKLLFYFYLVLVAVLPSLILSVQNEIIYTAAGSRWLIPILLPFFVYKAVDISFLEKISRYLFVLLMLHFSLQILQMFLATSWYGVSSFGLNKRNPGLFFNPNTASFFTLISLYAILMFNELTKLTRLLVVAVSISSIFLTMSGTGFVVLTLILSAYYIRKKYVIYFPLALPIAIVISMVFLLNLIERGENYIEMSGDTRVKIFQEVLLAAPIFSSNFGLGTNAAVVIGNASIVDSTFASIVVNLGYWGLFVFIFLLWIGFSYSILIKSRPLFILLAIMTFHSATTIIYEVYPANFLSSIFLAYFVKNRSNF